MRVQFRVLGPLEVREGDALLPVRRGRPRSLVHLLLLNRRVALSPEVVADRLWEDEPPVDAANAVHQLVSYLRRAMGPAGRQLLVTTPTGYALQVADTDVDSRELERLVQDALLDVAFGTAGGAQRCLEAAEAALRLWRGEPYVESSGYAWAAGDAARLQDTYLQAQEVRLEAMLTLGRHREVVLEAQSLATAYPLREQLHCHLAVALYRSGRQGEALEVHRSVRRLLSDELGIDPGPSLQQLEQRILRQDPTLDWTPPADAVDLGPAGGEPAPVPAADEAAAPAPAALVPVSGPPPRPRGELVGRDHDLATAVGALADGRLLTVTGPGGVGKTRLATELAGARVEAADRVWFVGLDDVERDEFVAGTVADRLGLTDQYPHDPADRVLAALAGASGLLVLDSCEHVVPGVSALLARALDEAPGVRVLVTSRRPLGLDGEQVHRLSPLHVPPPRPAALDELRDNPAVRLFRERARRVRADFEVDADNAEDVAGIVRDVDGLPIAIELAAAHVDVAGPGAVRARIAGRIDALEPGPASGPGAQRRSLRAALDASLVLCSEGEREMFAELSVFPGSFDLAAVEAVTTAGPGAFPLLASLVRQSLLVSDGGSGYRMLAPLRGYAAERLVEGAGEAELRRRHAAWVAGCASRVGGRERASGMDKALVDLARLLPDARSALSWSLEVGDLDLAAEVAVGFAWLWTLRGLAEEGIGWLLQIKQVCDAEPHEGRREQRLRATVLRSLAMLANPVGRLELAVRSGEESVALMDRAGDRNGLAASLMTLGVSQWAVGRVADAATSHDRAVELMADRHGSWQYVAALTLRARAALDGGEADAADRIAAAVEAAEVGDQEQMLGLALACRARLLLRDGDAPAAAVTADAALRVWRSIDYSEGVMSALNLVGRARLGAGQAGAEPVFQEALTIARTTSHRGAACESVESLALAAAAAGRREHAYLLLAVAGRERRRLSAPAPGTDRPVLDRTLEELRAGLGEAVAAVEAQAPLVRFDDLVDRLLLAAPHVGLDRARQQRGAVTDTTFAEA